MASEVCIPKLEYDRLIKKAALADSLLTQIKGSTADIKAGRIKRVR